MPYPKHIQMTPAYEKYQPLFDAMYVHERARLKLEPDLFLSACPLCQIKGNGLTDELKKPENSENHENDDSDSLNQRRERDGGNNPIHERDDY